MIKHRRMLKMMLSGNRSVTLFIMLLSAFTNFAGAEPIAKAILISPSVTAQSVTGTVTHLQRGSDINLQDTILTSQDARAILRFTEGTVLTLGGSTKMQVKAFISNTDKKRANFEFIKGAFRIVTGSITKTINPDFTVHTPIGSIGVRGTDFWGGNLSDDNSIDVVLLESEHSVEVSNEFGTVTLTQVGEGTTLLPNKPPLSPRKWPQEKLNRAIQTITTKQP